MKKIGLIGGLSYQSTLLYYKGINDDVNARLGGLHSAEIILRNVDFQDFKDWMDAGEWSRVEEALVGMTSVLVDAGADCVAMACNTVHRVASGVEAFLAEVAPRHIPLIHISDAVAKKCAERNVKKIGLLGTKFTMSEGPVVQRLEKNGLEVLFPEDDDSRNSINDIIFNELCQGLINDESYSYVMGHIFGLVEAGAQGIVLGCTELQMLFSPEDELVCEVPIIDTAQSHIDALAEVCVS